MKFLGWMHWKLKETSPEPIKNHAAGCRFSAQKITVFHEENYHVDAKRMISDFECQRFSKRIELNDLKELFEDDLFDFLAIGTFGIELLNGGPTSQLELDTHQMEFTEDEFDQTSNGEPEKNLDAEEEDGDDTSSSAGQSTISEFFRFSNKMIHEENYEGLVHTLAYPVQSCNFANGTNMACKNEDTRKEKTSLEELFKMEDDTKEKNGGVKTQLKKTAARFMKRVLKTFHASASASLKVDTVAPVSEKKKLIKTLKMFHGTVHPAETIDIRISKMQDGEKRGISGKHVIQKNTESYHDHTMLDQVANQRTENSTKNIIGGSIYTAVSNISGGQWIKTDPEFVVLEVK